MYASPGENCNPLICIDLEKNVVLKWKILFVTCDWPHYSLITLENNSAEKKISPNQP